MKKNVFFICLTILLSISLSSCVQKRSTLLDDVDCNAPCWKNIRPGTTNMADATYYLEIDQSIFKESLEQNGIRYVKSKDEINWAFPSNYSEYGGTINLHNDIVTKLTFGVESITLGDLVEKYGPPEKVFAIGTMYETKWIWIDLLYPTKGIIVEYIDFRYGGDLTGFFDLEKNLLSTRVFYFDPILYEEILETEIYDELSFYVNEESLNNTISNWKGFGEIECPTLPPR